MKITYDELKNDIDNIEVPAQRLGIFNVEIFNRGKYYFFKTLKQNVGDDIGFGLNHYGFGLSRQKYKRSKFHDEEDVCIDESAPRNTQNTPLRVAYKKQNLISRDT